MKIKHRATRFCWNNTKHELSIDERIEIAETLNNFRDMLRDVLRSLSYNNLKEN